MNNTTPTSAPSDMNEHLVVISDEGRYSIWPAYKQLPWGWRSEGMRGDKEACLAHIGKVWTDMRPQSLKEQDLAQQAIA